MTAVYGCIFLLLTIKQLLHLVIFTYLILPDLLLLMMIIFVSWFILGLSDTWNKSIQILTITSSLWSKYYFWYSIYKLNFYLTPHQMDCAEATSIKQAHNFINSLCSIVLHWIQHLLHKAYRSIVLSIVMWDLCVHISIVCVCVCVCVHGHLFMSCSWLIWAKSAYWET